MNGREGIFKYFVLAVLVVIIVLQIASIKRADRLNDKLAEFIEAVENKQFGTAAIKQESEKKAADLPMPARIGDDGDWLVWCLRGEPHTLNTITVASDTYSNYVCLGNVFERLLEYDPDEVKLKPWLAESYEVSEDGLEMVIKLRDDIHFSDGVSITADDVIFTFETIMDPNIDAASLRNYYKNFKQAIKIDERTVKFVFDEVFWKTFEVVGLFEVYPKHIYDYNDPEEFNTRRSDPVGSGPYVFEKWDVAQQIVLKRNENYWGHKPKIKKLVFRIVNNDVAALQSLQSNQIDLLIPSPEQYYDFQSDEEFKKRFHCLKYWNPGVPFFFIGWNQQREFFKDRRVRLAMTHIVDRETIAKLLLKGNAEVVTGPFYPYGRQHNPDIKPWPYDIKKAKQLLDEAGWVDSDGDGIRDKDGVSFKFKFAYSSGRPIYEQIAKLLKDEGEKVGIEVQADPYEWSVFIERLNTRQFDSVTLGFGGTVESDPYQMFHSSQIEGRGNNFIGFNNPEADKLIEIARRELDEDKRYALYHEFERLLHEEQPYTFLFTRPSFRFIDKRFDNIVIHKLGLDEKEWYVPKSKQRYK